MTSRRTVLLFSAALLWLAGVILSYYVYHKPFDLDLAAGLLTAAWRLLSAFLILAAGGAIGSKLAPLDGLPPLARASLQAALGSGLLALAVLISGTLLGVSQPVFLAGLAFLLVSLRSAASVWLRQWRDVSRVVTAASGLSRALMILSAVILLAVLASALAPPLAYDALVYHLTDPMAFLEAGRITHLPWNAYSGVPHLSEMLYLWAVALSGPAGAAVLGYLAGVMALLGVLGYVEERIDASAAWVAAASLLAGAETALLLAAAYVEWFGLWFGFGLLVLFDRWREAGQARLLALAGVFAGLAFGTKYTGGVLAVAAAAALLWHAWRARRVLLTAALRFGLPALAVALPWLVKNLFETGNPFFPFLLTSPGMSAVRQETFHSLPAHGNLLDLFFTPLRATYQGAEANDGYMIAIGPLLMAFSALAWMGWKNRLESRQDSLQNASVLALTGWLVWAAANQASGVLVQTRFYFSLFPAWALLAAFGYDAARALTLPGVRLGRVAGALLLLVMALTGLDSVVHALRSQAPQAAVGIVSTSEYLRRNLGSYGAVISEIDSLPAGSRVQMLYETRSLYCRPVCVPDETLDQWKRGLRETGTAHGALQRWQQAGITHLLVNRQGVQFFRDNPHPYHPQNELDALDGLLQDLPVVEITAGDYELYRIP